MTGGMINSRICEVFKSTVREGMYLYVERSEGLSRVPDALLQRFGAVKSIMVMKLDAQRRLAQASAHDVLTALDSDGYYLQLPPVPSHGTVRGRVTASVNVSGVTTAENGPVSNDESSPDAGADLRNEDTTC